MTELKSVLDRDLLKRAAENLEAEAQLCMARAQRWAKEHDKQPREGDDKAYERWAELHRAAKALLAIALKAAR